MTRSRSSSLLAAAVLALSAVLTGSAGAHPEGPAHHAPLPAHASPNMRAFAEDLQAPSTAAASGPAVCSGGVAGAARYPCKGVDLLAYLPLADIGGTRSNSAANDIWGWTDPGTEPGTAREYAIIGRVFGTSFIDITEPTNPVYLGELPTHGAFGSSWRDVKVYADHAFIVSEALGHGMQVFDLKRLRNVSAPPVTFTETAHYNKMASAHNIAINEDTGFAYIVGASGKNSCSGGLHMVNIKAPTSPSFAGCFSADGYTHDTQCVLYSGPDAAHSGKEICFNSNEDTLTIVDVSRKSAPVQISRTPYRGSAYTHQGWLTADQASFLLDDELDERDFGHRTMTRVFDVSDLEAPVLAGSFESLSSTAIDHNQYVKDDLSYQANYRAGLRILDASEARCGKLEELGYFDIYPADDAAEFNGAWSTYPYYDSGVVVVSGIEQGLFVLKPNVTAGTDDCPTTSPPPSTSVHVHDLDGSATSAKAGRWNATVTATVYAEGDTTPVSAATVTGTWSGGASGTASCTTDATGSCSVSVTNVARTSSSVTLTVTGVSASGATYDPDANHDPETDSDGTSLTVAKP